MVHLGRFAWPHSEMNYQEKVNFCRNVAEQAHSSSGLLAATKQAKSLAGTSLLKTRQAITITTLKRNFAKRYFTKTTRTPAMDTTQNIK
jgi:hypothetical protein